MKNGSSGRGEGGVLLAIGVGVGRAGGEACEGEGGQKEEA